MSFLQLKRREFIAVVGGVAVWPLCAHSQNQLARIGVLIDIGENHPAAKRWIELFETQLGLTGWQKGRNVEIAYRWGASNPELLARYAEELMQLKPDVFMVHGTPALMPLQKLTNAIPIVFTAVSDPISQGFVTNVSHPGGNLTGFSNFDTDIGSKWLLRIVLVGCQNKRSFTVGAISLSTSRASLLHLVFEDSSVRNCHRRRFILTTGWAV